MISPDVDRLRGHLLLGGTRKPNDHWHELVRVRLDELTPGRVITTTAVATEVLNHFSAAGGYWRSRACMLVESLIQHDNVTVVHCDAHLLAAGMALYRSRLDEDYSLTDCISMVVMRQHGVNSVLTRDHHFSQEGFDLLL